MLSYFPFVLSPISTSKGRRWSVRVDRLASVRLLFFRSHSSLAVMRNGTSTACGGSGPGSLGWSSLISPSPFPARSPSPGARLSFVLCQDAVTANKWSGVSAEVQPLSRGRFCRLCGVLVQFFSFVDGPRPSRRSWGARQAGHFSPAGGALLADSLATQSPAHSSVPLTVPIILSGWAFWFDLRQRLPSDLRSLLSKGSRRKCDRS
jgi:hypothetical protein